MRAFKTGALSAVGHDVELEATSVVVEATTSSVRAEIDASSLRVRHALRGDRPDPEALSGRDRRSIEDNARDDVLQAGRHPRITFVSTAVEPQADGGVVVRGDLTLHGVTRPIELHARRDGDHLAAEIDLDQTQYGIRPFTAMLGALKVQPVVRVRVRVRAPVAQS